MTIDVKKLLKVLPIDGKVRDEILPKFDSLSDDQKLEIREFCWNMYFALLKNKIKHEFDLALLDMKDGKREMDKNLYQEIENKVVHEFDQKIAQIDEQENLEKVRKELQQIVIQPEPVSS